MRSDYEEIRQLNYEYALLNDAGDWDGMAELFAHARLRGIIDEKAGEWTQGADAIRAFYVDQVKTYHDGKLVPYTAGSPRTRHVITNELIDIESGGETASAKSYLTVFQAPPRSLPFEVIVGGRYFDRFAKVDGVWRFTEKTIQIDFTNDISHHVDPYQFAD